MHNAIELRDYFAGQVIAGLQASGLAKTVATRIDREGAASQKTAKTTSGIMAHIAYQVADAMIAERERQH